MGHIALAGGGGGDGLSVGYSIWYLALHPDPDQGTFCGSVMCHDTPSGVLLVVMVVVLFPDCFGAHFVMHQIVPNTWHLVLFSI